MKGVIIIADVSANGFLLNDQMIELFAKYNMHCEHLPSCGCGCRGAAISGQHSIYGIDID